MSTKKRKRHSPEQIVAKLRDATALLNAGKDMAVVLQTLQVSESTYERWQTQYGGMKSEEALRLKPMNVETLYIELGSPWQNGYAESFHSRYRDEFLAIEEFESLAAARRLTNAWKEDYNQVRPHSGLDYQTPVAFPPRVLLPLRLRLRSSKTRVFPLPPPSTNRYLHNVWYRNSEPVTEMHRE